MGGVRLLVIACSVALNAPLGAGSAACATLPAASATGSIDSLVALPAWEPFDPEARLHLVPHSLSLDPVGRLWLLDRSRGRIMRLGPDGTGHSFSVTARADGMLTPAADLAISGAFLFLLEPTSPSISLLDLDGLFRERVDLAPELDRAGQRGFVASRLLVGRSGDLWLLEPRTAGLLHLDRRGRFLDAPLDALGGGDRPRRIADAAPGPDDGIVLLDAERPAILLIRATGAPQPPQPLEPPVVEPASLAVDAAGRRYVLEGNRRLRILDAEGLLLWDGLLPGKGLTGLHRTCVTADNVLCSTDPSRGLIHRWQTARSELEDAQR